MAPTVWTVALLVGVCLHSSEVPQTLRVGTPRQGGGVGIEVFGLEDYVARVLSGEAAAGSPPAALEALAITVRTFAIANRGRHQRDGFDLCTLTHCQVLRATYAAVRDAASATQGQLLLAHGAPGRSSIRRRAGAGPSGRRRCGPAPRIRPTCRRRRIGRAAVSLAGPPRSRCRIWRAP